MELLLSIIISVLGSAVFYGFALSIVDRDSTPTTKRKDFAIFLLGFFSSNLCAVLAATKGLSLGAALAVFITIELINFILCCLVCEKVGLTTLNVLFSLSDEEFRAEKLNELSSKIRGLTAQALAAAFDPRLKLQKMAARPAPILTGQGEPEYVALARKVAELEGLVVLSDEERLQRTGLVLQVERLTREVLAATWSLQLQDGYVTVLKADVESVQKHDLPQEIATGLSVFVTAREATRDQQRAENNQLVETLDAASEQLTQHLKIRKKVLSPEQALARAHQAIAASKQITK